MKKLLTLLVLSGLVSFGTVKAQAQGIIPVFLNVKLTAQVQDLLRHQVGTSPVQKSTVVKMKVTTKDLLSLLAIAYNTNFTNATVIVDDASGNFLVIDFNGNVLQNATADGFLNNFFDDESDALLSGSENPTAQVNNLTYLFVNEIRFLDGPNTNRFDFSGQEKFTVVDSSNGRFKDTFTLTGAGTGEIENPPAAIRGASLVVLTGTVSGSTQ